MAAFRQLRYAFAGDGEPLDVPSVRATPNLFTVLGVNAMLGRTFLAEEGAPGADRVAILSRAVLGAALRRIAERDRPDDSARRRARTPWSA